MPVSANTVTIVIALAAIVSPILVALINNVHQSKLKKLEFEHNERLKAQELTAQREERNIRYLYSIYENYLQSTSRCIANPSRENLKLYGENYSIAFVYLPPKCHDQLKSINDSIRDCSWKDANEKLEHLSIWLSGIMKEMLIGL